MLKYDIIQIKFKYCVSQMYIIVLSPNIKLTYNQINMIKKIRALYRELILFPR